MSDKPRCPCCGRRGCIRPHADHPNCGRPHLDSEEAARRAASLAAAVMAEVPRHVLVEVFTESPFGSLRTLSGLRVRLSTSWPMLERTKATITAHEPEAILRAVAEVVERMEAAPPGSSLVVDLRAPHEA